MKQRKNKSEKRKSNPGSTTKGARAHKRIKHGIGKGGVKEKGKLRK